jgi:DNA topoisomerase-1
MTKTLVIVESPSKAKTIEKYLGPDYTVKASVGHVRDLPKSNKNAVDIDNDFAPTYEVSPKKKEVVDELRKLAKNSDEILLATDPDREGEAISWHLYDLLVNNGRSKVSANKFKRVAFNEVTKDAVTTAVANPRDIDDELVRAQEARRVLDRLFGYDLSGLIWKKVRYGLSAGRVQSPALRILAEREREIKAFIPEDFWVLIANVKGGKPALEFELSCSEEPKTAERANEIVSKGKKSSWIVQDITETPHKRNPYSPFKTSTLQQTASSRLGFTPARTMRAAQKLYEKGFITYMRTDSISLSKEATAKLSSTVKSEFGPEHFQARSFKSKSKNTQEAHEAIRPTNPSVAVAGADADQKKLYNLIRARSLAALMKPAEQLRTKIIVSFDDNYPSFAVNGSQLTYPGWMLSDPGARRDDVELPNVATNEELKLLQLDSEAKQTQPPRRYSDAGLIKELEKRGIGRPSTYASIIKTLIDRSYVNKDGRSLQPTPTGMVVSEFLEKNFDNYISDDFTADLENRLDEIAEGKRTYPEVLKDFYNPFTKSIDDKKDIDKLTDLGPAPAEFPCPECQNEMVMKLGRNGIFMSCANFPECKGARTESGEEVPDDTVLGSDPNTGMDVLLKDGPYGYYVQVGEKDEEYELENGKTTKNKRPRRASIPAETDLDKFDLKQALHLLILPRELGEHPETGNNIIANIGRFGPYIAHNTKLKADFRSLKDEDPYDITFERALEILSEPKKTRWGNKKGKKKSKT